MSLLSSSAGSAPEPRCCPEPLRATTLLTTVPALCRALPTSHDVAEKPVAATVPRPEAATEAALPAAEPIPASTSPVLAPPPLLLPQPPLPTPPIRPLSPPEPPNLARILAAASSRSCICRATYSASDSPGKASTPLASGILTVPLECAHLFCGHAW
eukprot:scaffold32666_cov51-Phaeocystis_antarctica.AAC.3